MEQNQYEDRSLSLAFRQTAMGEALARKAMADIQIAIVMANKFPRDLQRCKVQACLEFEDYELACSAIYSFPRGGGTVSGASIKMLEVIARHFKNIKPGWAEVERLEDRSLCESWCWDFESNVPYSVVHWVMHTRDQQGNQAPKPLTQERDIYEKVANYSTRRMRSQMERHIPKYIINAVKKQAALTIAAGDGKEPWHVRTSNMLGAFAKIHVSQAMLEKRLGHPWNDVNQTEFAELYGIYNAINDKQVDRSEYFEFVSDKEESTMEAVRVDEARVDEAEKLRQITIIKIKESIARHKKDGVSDEAIEKLIGMTVVAIDDVKSQQKLNAIQNALKPKDKK